VKYKAAGVGLGGLGVQAHFNYVDRVSIQVIQV